MTGSEQHRSSALARLAGRAFLSLLFLTTAAQAQAQTFSVLYNFTGGADGYDPDAGVSVAPSGALYGTASFGGTYSYGTVFKLNEVNSGWVFSPLHEFTGGGDGAYPYGGVVLGPNGALYGTTEYGGPSDGTVFELRPPATVCKSVLCYWNETVLHSFTGSPTDGQYSETENLVFDRAGNIYGTTYAGGMYDVGTTFELTPSGGSWTESILHSFGYSHDGVFPYSGVVLDTAGNVYGTTTSGGTGSECPGECGTVYQLMPLNGGWVENVLVSFDSANESYPYGNLIIDDSGNLYGTTSGGQNGTGVVFKLAPSRGGFTYSTLYTFSSYCESFGSVAMDAAGDLFGVCFSGGAQGDGWIYELTDCSETCSVVDLHDFRHSDGAHPYGTPVLDANGNLYGTAAAGGTGKCEGNGCGVVWEIAGVGAPRKN